MQPDPDENAKEPDDRDALHARVIADHGPAIARLAAGYEADPEARRDLVQDIHVALWQSLARFDGRCSLRTWVFRVAHNTGVSHIRHDAARRRRDPPDMSRASRDGDMADDRADPERRVAARLDLDRLLTLIRELRPPDRQVMMLHLEGMDTAGIADVTGLSSGAVSTRLHRVRKMLAPYRDTDTP